jgi:hypothetical protein
MKIAIVPLLLCGGILAAQSMRAAEPATDPLTGLPMPIGTTVKLGSQPMKLDDTPLCKSMMQMDFYRTQGGNVDAALAWYSDRLKGFKHTHGYGSGRSQDSFYNATGTMMVSITGNEAKDGENTAVYSIIYATIKPGVSEKAIAGLNVQKVVCP